MTTATEGGEGEEGNGAAHVARRIGNGDSFRNAGREEASASCHLAAPLDDRPAKFVSQGARSEAELLPQSWRQKPREVLQNVVDHTLGALC